MSSACDEGTTALLRRVLGDEPAYGPFSDLTARLITLASED
ncbi:hypothetical protein [Streptomyces sp. cmx-4-7]